MTALLDMIAKEVVFEPPPSYKFDVDGEDFPWYITERGPIFTRVAEDLFVVDVEIINLSRENKNWLSFSYGSFPDQPPGDEWEGPPPHIPVIGGEPFPWLCTDDEMVLRFSHKQCPTLALKFFACDVSATSRWIDDKRDVFCAGGHLIATNAEAAV